MIMTQNINLVGQEEDEDEEEEEEKIYWHAVRRLDDHTIGVPIQDIRRLYRGRLLLKRLIRAVKTIKQCYYIRGWWWWWWW